MSAYLVGADVVQARTRIAQHAIALLTQGYPTGYRFEAGDMTDLAALRRGRKAFEQRP